MRKIISLLVAFVLAFASITSHAAGVSGVPSTLRPLNLFVAGTRVYPMLWAVKTTTEQRANTVTIADDAELTLNLEASKHYKVTLVLKFCGSTSGAMGYRFRVVAPGGVDTPSSVGWAMAFVGGVLSGPVEQAGISAADHTNATTQVCNAIDTYYKEAVILTSSAGVLKVQWAQNTTNALNLNLFRGSLLTAQKLN